MDYGYLLKATERFEKLAQNTPETIQPFTNAVIADALVAARLVKYTDNAGQEPTMVNPYFKTLMGIHDKFYKLIEKYNYLVKIQKSQDPRERATLDKQIKTLETEIDSIVGIYRITITATDKGIVKPTVENSKYFTHHAPENMMMSDFSRKIQLSVSNYIKQRKFSTEGTASLTLLPTFELDW